MIPVGRRWSTELFTSAVTYLYALHADSGTLLWSYPGGWVSSPAVVNGVVYIGSSDNNVYALDASTGVQLWKYTTGGPVWSHAGRGQWCSLRRLRLTVASMRWTLAQDLSYGGSLHLVRVTPKMRRSWPMASFTSLPGTFTR